MEHAHGGPAANAAPHHEESDVDIRGIVGFAIALVVVAAVMQIAVWLMFRYYERTMPPGAPDYPNAVQTEQAMPATPRLQTNPRQDLRDLRAEEDAVLSTYGWADKNTGEVRIPIDQAMKLTLQRGLPARNGAPPATSTSSGDSNSGRIVGRLPNAGK